MTVRRFQCAGVMGRACPAWWYAERRPGRPVERCPRCRALHEAARRAENHRNDVEKHHVLAKLAISMPADTVDA